MSTVILACGDRGSHGGSEAIPPDLGGVTYVEDLCRKPGDLSPLIEGADRVVMIVHSGERSLAGLQQSVRAAGIDPLGVQYLSASALGGDASRAGVLLQGALARVATYEESSPEQSRPTFGGPRSRRDILSVPRPHYDAVPLIDDAVCAADSGCRACVAECPQLAYHWSRGKVYFNREACVTCGRCVTACPTGAIANPTISPRALTDQIAALVTGAAPDPLGIAFVCRQRTSSICDAAWAEVEVPCTAMVPATWPVAALMLGASRAAIMPCSDTGCGLGDDGRALAAVAAAGELLTSAGFEPTAVTSVPEPLLLPLAPLGPVTLEDPFGIHGPTEVALALHAMAAPSRPIGTSSPMAFRGVVAIDTDACTLCLACTETCPTGALNGDATVDWLEVTFDATRCNGCSQCVAVCPEVERGAIAVDHRIDSGALQAGRQTLSASATATCELCGAPIASTAMLSRISALLGAEHGAAMNYMERRCLDCRGVS